MDVSHCAAPSSAVRGKVSCRLLCSHIAHRRHDILLFGSASGELHPNYVVLYHHFDNILHSLPTALLAGLAHKILYAAILSSPHLSSPSTSTNVQNVLMAWLSLLPRICRLGFNRRSGYRIYYILLSHPLESVVIEPSVTI